MTQPVTSSLITTPAEVEQARLRTAPQAAWRRSIVVAIVLALLVAYPFVLPTAFWLNVGILSLIFGMAGQGWNILGGYTGQISFGNAVFFGAGAYTTAVLVRVGWLPWPGMVLGVLVGAALAVIVGFPCFRLRSHYFAIATIAVGEIADVVVSNTTSLGGSSGLQVPLRSNGLATLQFSVRDPTPYYFVALALLALVMVAAWLFVRGRAGAYARAVRDDEMAAAAVGIPIRRYKLYAAALSGALTALAGGFYVMYSLYVNPSLVLDLSVSIDIVLIAVLGGAGTLWGPLLGAWLLTLLQENVREQFGGTGSGVELLVFGLLIVVISIVEPGGLMALGARLRRLLRRSFRHRLTSVFELVRR